MDSLRLLATVPVAYTASDLKSSMNKQETGRSSLPTSSYPEAWKQVRNLGISKVDAAYTKARENVEGAKAAREEGSQLQLWGTIIGGPLIGTLIGVAIGESSNGSYDDRNVD